MGNKEYHVAMLINSYFIVDKSPSVWIKKIDSEFHNIYSVCSSPFQSGNILFFIYYNYKFSSFSIAWKWKEKDLRFSREESCFGETYVIEVDPDTHEISDLVSIDLSLGEEVRFNGYELRIIGARNQKHSVFAYDSNIWKDPICEKENSFIHQMCVYVSRKKYLKKLRHEYALWSEFWEVYHKANIEAEKYDIEEILQDLQITVEDHVSGCRPGKDEYYDVEETRTISYPVIELNDFLKQYLRIGTYTIYKDSGWEDCYIMQARYRKEHYVGVYSEEQVNKVKENLITRYKEKNLEFWLREHYENDLTELNAVLSYDLQLSDLFSNKFYDNIFDKMNGKKIHTLCDLIAEINKDSDLFQEGFSSRSFFDKIDVF